MSSIKRIQILVVASVFALISALAPYYPAFAQSELPEPDHYDISNNITFIGGDNCEVPGEGAPAQGDLPVPPGADSIERSFKFFHELLVKKNSEHPKEQAAGIVGNLLLESNLNPKIVNEIGAYGIAQWLSVRRELLQQRANYDTLDVQLNYIWWEITQGPEKGSLTALLRESTPRGAAISWENNFERAGGAGMAERIEYAEQVFRDYSGSVSGGSAGGSPAGTECFPAEGGLGAVNAEGYSYPVAPQRKSQNGGITNLSAQPCQNLGSPYCHHDRTPAFDLGRQPGGDASAGAPIYAIKDGTINNTRVYKGIRGCHSLHLTADDKFDYYYTHLGSVSKSSGNVKAGDQIAVIGPRRCTGNGSLPHLHIDRGCVRNGVPQPAGYDSCRDPGFVPLLNSIFNALPN